MAPRILIVEDSASMRAFVRAALETLLPEALVVAGAPAGRQPDDLELIEASNGFEALRLLPRGPYDLVITDINMPDVNGLELVRFIRGNETHATTPVLLMSTQSAERDRERGLALGASDFLTKPFTPEALLSVTLPLLRQRSRAAGHGGGGGGKDASGGGVGP